MRKAGGRTLTWLPFVLSTALLLSSVLAAQTPAPVTPSEAAIRAELDRQAAAWNHGDLKAYMHGYWHSPELTFFAGNTELSGWEEAYQRYRTAYQGKDKEMGHLDFSNIQIAMLAPDAAFARGSWQLTRKDGSHRKGLFTLVLKKFDDGWRIIHDHSS